MAEGASGLFGLAPALVDAIPLPILVVDQDVRILSYNSAAAALLGDDPERVLRQRGGSALRCINSLTTAAGCGGSPACKRCVIRESVRNAMAGRQTVRRRVHLERIVDGTRPSLYMLITTTPLPPPAEGQAVLLLEDISDLMELGRMVSICGYCRKVRDEEQRWGELELYFKRHLDLDFSHGICPECARKHFPEHYGGA